METWVRDEQLPRANSAQEYYVWNKTWPHAWEKAQTSIKHAQILWIIFFKGRKLLPNPLNRQQIRLRLTVTKICVGFTEQYLWNDSFPKVKLVGIPPHAVSALPPTGDIFSITKHNTWTVPNFKKLIFGGVPDQMVRKAKYHWFISPTLQSNMKDNGPYQKE